MYLNNLSELQKERFLDLGINLAKVDGEFSRKEELAIGLLCDEMHIKKRVASEYSTEKTINFFVDNADMKAKRIVILELLGIALADEYFSSCEKEIIMKIANSFAISKEDFENVSNTITELYALYGRLNNFINK